MRSLIRKSFKTELFGCFVIVTIIPLFICGVFMARAIHVNGKYFPANSAINFQQISAVKNQQFIMPHISRGVSPGSVIYSNGRLTS